MCNCEFTKFYCKSKVQTVVFQTEPQSFSNLDQIEVQSAEVGAKRTIRVIILDMIYDLKRDHVSSADRAATAVDSSAEGERSGRIGRPGRPGRKAESCRAAQ